MVEIDALKSLPSVGMATFTIVRSSTVMIVPRTTTAPSTRTSRPSAPAPVEPGLLVLWVLVAAAVIATPSLACHLGQIFGVSLNIERL